MNDFFDDKIAERLGGVNFGKSTAIYKFELIKRAKAVARKAHPDTELIDMGVGEPDFMTPWRVSDADGLRGALAEALKAGQDPRALETNLEPALKEFLKRRDAALLYR